MINLITTNESCKKKMILPYQQGYWFLLGKIKI